MTGSDSALSFGSIQLIGMVRWQSINARLQHVCDKEHRQLWAELRV